jgi:hypothetical protein
MVSSSYDHWYLYFKFFLLSFRMKADTFRLINPHTSSPSAHLNYI